MARETFLFRADVTNALIAGRQYGIDGNWTGYQSPACLYNKKGSGKVIRVRQVSISATSQTDINEPAAHQFNIVSITGHSVVNSNYSVVPVDSNNDSLPATIEIGTDVFSATTSQTILRTGAYHQYSPRAVNVTPYYNRDYLVRWNDATTSEYQRITLANGQGIAVTGGPLSGNNYQYPITINVVIRVSDTGATYIIRGMAKARVPYVFTLLNNGYTAGNVEIVQVQLAQEQPFTDIETPVSNQDHTQEIIYIKNAQVDSAGSQATPFSMDTANSLNSNVLCLKSATVVPYGQINGSYSRTITVGNSLMRVRNAWTEQRDILLSRTKGNVLLNSKDVETDMVLREGMGIAYIPSTYDGYGGCYYIEFLFTQENTEANAIYPAVGDVDLSIQYGPTGTDYTGTLAQPAVGDVRSGTTYGAGGTEFTGTLTAGGGGGNVFIINE